MIATCLYQNKYSDTSTPRLHVHRFRQTKHLSFSTMKLLILTLLIGVACAAVLRKETRRNEVMNMLHDLLAERDEAREVSTEGRDEAREVRTEGRDEAREVRNVLRELLAERDQARRAKYVRRIPNEAQIRQLFSLIDEDGDGEITFTEFKTALRFSSALNGGTYYEDDEVRKMIEFADTNGSGTLNFEEFRNGGLENNSWI